MKVGRIRIDKITFHVICAVHVVKRKKRNKTNGFGAPVPALNVAESVCVVLGMPENSESIGFSLNSCLLLKTRMMRAVRWTQTVMLQAVKLKHCAYKTLQS